MYFKTISLDLVPIHVLADQFTTFLTLFNSLWLNFSFVLSLRMSSYLSRSQKKFSSILHGWFFFCDPVFSNRHTNRLFLLFVFWQYLLKTKKHPWNFLRSMKEDAVHNLLSPLLWRVTFFESFSSIVCSFCDILIEFIRHMRKDNRAPWFSYYSANRGADI